MEALLRNSAASLIPGSAVNDLQGLSAGSCSSERHVSVASVWKGQTSKLKIRNRGAKKCRVEARKVRMEGNDSSGDAQGPGKVATGTGGVREGEEADVKVSEMLKSLRQQMKEATEQEDYQEAARVRDLVRTLEESDPVLQLQRALAKAIEEERYADASAHRDELKTLLPPEPEKPIMATVNCTSDTITAGVRVRVRSIYVRDRSTPSRQQYFFAYRIRISNEGSRAVQLLNRHWVITDANGRTEEVRGPGVIGEQPVLRPGASFEYTSACPLRTPYGTMEGEYEMISCEEPGSDPFEVKVGPFALNVNNDEL